MSSQLTSDIVIIGGGLASLILALSLHQRNISCTIYEARPEDASTPGALMLSPNSVRILDGLGIYSQLRSQGYNFSQVTFKNAAEETTDVYHLGGTSLYVYDCLRIYRQTLLLALRAAAHRANIPIHYATKFSHIEQEDAHGVTFALADGTIRTASLLIGADGIHSRIRTNYIAPDTPARYSGRLALTFATSRAAAGVPLSYPLPTSIFSAPGAFVMAPQTPDGASEMLAGTQVAFAEPEDGRAGWAALGADKARLMGMLRERREEWPETVKGVLDAEVHEGSVAMWPFYVVPKLERWGSSGGRVVVLGDAAHAIPPTAGQGASQAMEDAVTFAEVVGLGSEGKKWDGEEEERWMLSVKRWQEYRQQRVDRVIELTRQLNNARLPADERARLGEGEVWKSGGDGELAWLYCADVVQELGEWLRGGIDGRV